MLGAASAAILSFSLIASTALSRPTIRRAFFEGAYPSAVGSRLDNLPSHSTHCGVCHYDFNGGGARNLYGLAVQAALPNFPNTDNGRRDAILSIQNQDSDTDGYTNLAEITDLTTYSNTPTFPGLNASNVSNVSNVPVLAEITPYLVPVSGGDVTPPVVTLTSPNGAESWVGGSSHTLTWNASDNVAVTSVDLFYRDGESAPWTMIARGLGNTGSFPWFVHNTPTAAARVRAVGYDAAGNQGSDQSNALFTITATPGGKVATTLRDFHQRGSQPFEAGQFQDHSSCASCHAGYDAAVEPDHGFKGSMMGQAARDPLFYACLAVAEQDAPGAGDLCLRCHTPFGWLSGRSNPTSGSQLSALDRDGVSCDFCHRMVDPIYAPGTSPTEDQEVLSMISGHVPTGYLNGQYVVDPQPRRRGPFADAIAPHPFLDSPLHRSSRMCATCHDVSNPVFNRVSGADYAPGPLDQAADSTSSLVLLPLERTYSEWLNSDYPSGVYAPDFAGNDPGGIVSTCQDCHMRSVDGKGCNDPAAPQRSNLPLHDMMGGNAWIPGILSQIYPTEVDAAALAAGAARAVSMLQKAAVLGLSVAVEGDSTRATVTVTNRTGHKLPTGYPEGRRMWVQLVARDAASSIVYQSGAYDAATGVLEQDLNLAIYQVELGLSPALATGLSLPTGPSFHFALNDSIYLDTRIPPLGFTNAAYEAFGGAPVDPGGPSPRYADGQNWDVSSYGLPRAARSATVTLYYQTTSKEYVEFLRDENITNPAGQNLYDLWTGNGRSAPVAMATVSAEFSPTAVPAGMERPDLNLAAMRNPFHGGLELRLDLSRPAQVTLEILDPRGRIIARRHEGVLGGGSHRLSWDGRDGAGRDAGSGVFWARVIADRAKVVRKVVRLD